MDFSSEKQIKQFLSSRGFRFSKSLGQNFLVDPEVPFKIAEYSELSPESGVIEIGPGIGALTRELSKRAKKVLAIELDRNLFPLLGETLHDCTNVSLVHGDVLKLDLKSLIQDEFQGSDVKICANLPYYITTPVIIKLLEEKLPVSSITLMIQKEVAMRICAPPGSKNCGAITYLVNYLADSKMLFDVPPNSFIPAPKVTSTVISLSPIPGARFTPTDEKKLFSLIRAGFQNRRKTLANGLFAAGYDKASVLSALASLGLSEAVRGETLSLHDFENLSRLI